MTKPKTIVLWRGKDILSCSIKAILPIQKDWEFITISKLKDLENLFKTGETPQNDVVIILPRYSASLSKLPLQFLQDYPSIKVITLNLENNDVEVYRKQKINIHKASDLINVIESEA